MEKDNDLDVRLNLRIQLNHKVNKRELLAMIKEAVESWGGSLNPQDPLFNGVKKVTVFHNKVAP